MRPETTWMPGITMVDARRTAGRQKMEGVRSYAVNGHICIFGGGNTTFEGLTPCLIFIARARNTTFEGLTPCLIFIARARNTTFEVLTPCLIFIARARNTTFEGLTPCLIFIARARNSKKHVMAEVYIVVTESVRVWYIVGITDSYPEAEKMIADAADYEENNFGEVESKKILTATLGKNYLIEGKQGPFALDWPNPDTLPPRESRN